MSRAGLIVLMFFAPACSASLDIPAPRLVLLQYANVPTSADSLAASQIAGSPATIYPIIHTMTVRTRVATTAFAALSPEPQVTDGNHVAPNCTGPSVFFTTNHLVTGSDSAAAALAGIRVVTYSRNLTDFAGDFETAALNSVLSMVDGLAADTNIATVNLDLGSCTISEFSLHGR